MGVERNMEKTFLMIKPDGVQRGFVGEIVNKFEKKGFKMLGLKLMQVTEEIASKHYAEHVGKPFYPGLIEYITSGPVVAMCFQGKNVVAEARKMMGSTNPADAAPGTIRGDYGQDIGRNLIHGSDSVESAANELAVYFDAVEILDYEYLPEKWLFE